MKASSSYISRKKTCVREMTEKSIEAWRRLTQIDRQLTHRYLINFIKIHELLPEKLTKMYKKTTTKQKHKRR